MLQRWLLLLLCLLLSNGHLFLAALENDKLLLNLEQLVEQRVLFGEQLLVVFEYVAHLGLALLPLFGQRPFGALLLFGYSLR